MSFSGLKKRGVILGAISGQSAVIFLGGGQSLI